ncbi:MAG TPA: DUF3108 domain-containing protein [Steroidobacteraceae bacterium]
MSRRRPEAFSALLAALALVATLAQAASVPMKPYTARYQVSYRGLTGGQIEASFRPGSVPGQWLYETHAFPNFFGRLAISPAAHERSTMSIGPSGVQPLVFEFDDGSADSSKDVKHTFDWTARQVSGVSKGKPFSFDVTPGTQNTASVQAAMIVERLNGRMPTGFRILTGDRLRDYKYWSEGTQQIVTPFGQVEAEVWASQGISSDRVSRVWHAPSLGFVPVQAIQYRKGSPEVQMKLISLQR